MPILYSFLFIVILIGAGAIFYVYQYNKLQHSKTKIEHAECLIDEALRNTYDILMKADKVVQTELGEDKTFFKGLDKVKDENISNFDLDRKLTEYINLISKVKADNSDFADAKETKKLNKFIKEEDIDSSEEKEYFLTVTKEATSASEAIDMFNDAKGKLDQWEEIDLEPLHEDLNSIKDAYKKVSDAIKEYEEHSYLSLETIQELIQLDDKYLNCLYDEEGQLVLNTEAYNNLTRAKLEEMNVGVINNALDIVEGLNDEATAANYLKDANIDLTSVNWDLFESNIALARSELALLGDTEAIEQRQAALDQIVTSTKARIKLINDAEKSVGEGQNKPYFYTGESDTDSGGNDDNEIDWSEQSLKVLEMKWISSKMYWITLMDMTTRLMQLII